MNFRRVVLSLAIAWFLIASSGQLTAGILDLDFTSDGSGNAGAFGGSPTIYGTAPGYTAFVVAELGPAQNTTANPTVTVAGVTFTINGNISAWPGNNGNLTPDLLRGDYLFLGAANSVLGVTPFPMPWTVTGLTPNTPYVFTFTHGNNAGAARSVKIDSGAQTLTINGVTGTHFGNLTVSSDGSGAITGTFTGQGGEGNLAAMSLNRVRVPGDVNGDNLVNDADFNVISANLFTTQLPYSNGDLDFSGFVDFADFRMWKAAAGSEFANASIPEPTSGSLAVVSLFACGLCRRRRAK